MSDAGMPVVWVLGAGFSKPLGAPLLDDLFSFSLTEDLRARYEGDRYTDFRMDVDNIYEVYGLNLQSRHGPGQPWEDAEQFMDYVDSAAIEDPGGVTIKRILQYCQSSTVRCLSADEISKAARRVLAASCDHFLKGANLRSERWMPFISWAQSLGRNDTIITFNYDRIPELLASETRLEIIQPRPDGFEVDPHPRPKVFKLHGSVGWYIEGSVLRSTEDVDTLLAESRDICIATPGPTKKQTKDDRFLQMWHAAKRSLSEARAIVFIGYRFPETDAEARRWLLDGIRENESKMLNIYTVLGPDVNSSDSQRLLGLLRYAVHGRAIWLDTGPKWEGSQSKRARFFRRPLYSQDYVSVIDRAKGIL